MCIAAEAREAALGQEKAQLKSALATALEHKAGLDASFAEAQEDIVHLQAEVCLIAG